MGSLPQGEEFQTGIWISRADVPVSQATLQTECDRIAAAWQAHNGPIVQLITGTTTYQLLRLYDYPTGGNAPAERIAETTLQQNGGGVGNTLLPLQIALVATLRTGIAGRRYRGRQYYPMNAQTLGDHQVSQSTIDAVAGAVADWYNAINSGGTLISSVVVMSTAAGSSSAVTAVEVDSRPDVQRRRADQQTENRQSVPGVVT